ncbi:MAG TPA: triose-phosphate isomerase, partial [Clostridia bacterium]|nr:triose-phosphate isomerase [Clostridia bacterium]
RQVKLALKNVSGERAAKAWLAYEPVWAIGEQGIPAEPDYIGAIHTSIRSVLVELYGEETAGKIPLLYGGSVNIDNAVPFISEPNVDGLFIGRSAWNAKSFRDIMIKINDVQI